VRVHWTGHARNRLNQIFPYIASDSDARAAELIARLFASAEQLTKYPWSGPLLPEDPAYRQLVADGYRIVYQVGADAVVVMTVVAPGMPYGKAH